MAGGAPPPMIPADRRLLGGGAALVVAGMALVTALGASVPAGQPGMTDEEAAALLEAQRENRDYTALAGMLIGVGFLLVLVSFGARRRGGAAAKRQEKRAEA